MTNFSDQLLGRLAALMGDGWGDVLPPLLILAILGAMSLFLLV